MTPGQAVERLLRQLAIERGLSAHTTAAYRRDLTGYLAVLDARGVTDASAITGDDVAAFRTSLADRGLAPASVARHLSAVKALHRWLVDERVAVDDVAKDQRPPKQPSRLPKAISVTQMQRLLETVSGDDPASLRDRALLELLYATGARISEACGLSLGDFDRDGGLVRLFGKGAKERIVPYGRHASAAMGEWLGAAGRLAAIVGLIATFQSGVGLLLPNVYRDNALVRAAWHGNDLVTLLLDGWVKLSRLARMAPKGVRRAQASWPLRRRM